MLRGIGVLVRPRTRIVVRSEDDALFGFGTILRNEVATRQRFAVPSLDSSGLHSGGESEACKLREDVVTTGFVGFRPRCACAKVTLLLCEMIGRIAIERYFANQGGVDGGGGVGGGFTTFAGCARKCEGKEPSKEAERFHREKRFYEVRGGNQCVAASCTCAMTRRKFPPHSFSRS